MISIVGNARIRRKAVFSECRNYRYMLSRSWDAVKPGVLFIGLNPSTADARVDDPTCRVCVNYAQRWGYGAMTVANLFAYCATYPAELRRAAAPVGPRNDAWLRRLVHAVNSAAIDGTSGPAPCVVCVWGDMGRYLARDEQVLAMIDNPRCLKILGSGAPGHPLYKRRELVPVPYRA